MEALGHYLVELRRPPAGWEGLQQLAAEARAGAERLSAEGTSVRFLRAIFVPEEDNCFFLYQGPSVDAVREAGRRAALTIERVSPAVQVDPRPAVLTPTEEKVARLVAGGCTNPEAAATLGLSRKTVEGHLTRIYRKLDLRSRDEIRAALAEALGVSLPWASPCQEMSRAAH